MNLLKKFPHMPCTLILISIWIAVWVLVRLYGISPVLCGKGISKIDSEYYRFFTTGLTHQSILHLLANVSAMFWVGYVYEQYIGSIPFAITGVICAVGAQVLFLCIYQNTDNSIGGSVYPFALLGFGLAAQFLSPVFQKFHLVLGAAIGLQYIALHPIYRLSLPQISRQP